jgi:hypothetical protein
VAPKKLPKPAWYKNTYFWIAGILFILFIVGIVSGDATIRDPGQKREGLLSLLYLVASAIMLLNGFLSHAQTVQHYNETVGLQGSEAAAKSTAAVVPKAVDPPPDTIPKMNSVEETKQE